MIRDKRLEFFDKTDIKGGGLVGDIVDLGVARDIGGNAVPLYLVVKITTAGAGGTSMTFRLSTGDTAPGAVTSVFATQTFITSLLTKGATFVLPLPSADFKRYVRVNAVKGGTFTALSATAFLTTTAPKHASYPDATN